MGDPQVRLIQAPTALYWGTRQRNAARGPPVRRRGRGGQTVASPRDLWTAPNMERLDT